MHRATPSASSFRAFSSGGARALVDLVDDLKQMQEMGGSFMKGESRDKIESPQNYGFTSVVMPATKGKDGQIMESAEAFMSFMGGNRSFPVCAVMDDRRYRLKGLQPGDTAIYDHQQQQLHMNKDGTFLTGLREKKVRLQLADVDKQQEQPGGGGKAARAEGDSGSSDAGKSGEQKKTGQKSRYTKESKKYVDLNKDSLDHVHDVAINYKAPTHTFEGNVVIKGELKVEQDIKGLKNLRIKLEGYKPSNGDWVAGDVTALGEPIEEADLTAEQKAFLARKRAIMDKIRITDEGVFIDGDFTITGDLTVTGVVRAKRFEATG
jgi:phage gp45-like